MLNKNVGFIGLDKTLVLIEDSIKAAEEWKGDTNDAFNTSEKIQSFHLLIDILIELSWRYGKRVKYCFTKKSKIEGTSPVKDISPSEIPEPWDTRIFVDERDTYSPLVYIKF